MSLASGTLLGPYEIVSVLGAGGMGEVYRARDTRLDRTVAVKVLAFTLASDPDFRERFSREARAISQLEHPNICPLYDIGEHDGTAYLVMQFLEGETLASRLDRGALPLDQALRCAVEIAGALDRAHRAGIVHRDLKPANIMLTKTGAKLLDFGLAKGATPAAGLSGLSMLPTTPPGLTAQGTILGTVQYMAPEQLEGQEADARTDIFAFGAVLYEMVTGRKAFQGKSPVRLIGAILKDNPPPIASSQPIAPAALDRIVGTCLAKDPDERWQNASDLRRQLKWVTERDSDRPAPSSRTQSAHVRERIAWLVAGLALIAVVGLILFVVRRPSLPRPVSIRFDILPPPGTVFAGGPANPHPAISPDGRRIAFAVIDASGRGVLAVRDLGELQARVLTGTEGVRLGDTDADTGVGNGLPFWSSDSRFVGFFGGGALKKVEATGGPVQTLCSSGGGEGATWNADGTIVFASTGQSGLLRVSANGGTPTPVTTIDAAKQERSHRWPWFLPDGRHFLYVSMPSRTLFVGSLDSSERESLFEVQSKALYADGHLLFMRDGFVLAQPFDATERRVTGDAFPIAEDVGFNSSTLRAALSVSSTGVLAYRTIGEPNSQLVWLDRSGNEVDTLGEPTGQRAPHLSPDGTRVAVVRVDPATRTRDLWVYDVARGGRTRVTFDAAEETVAVWSPDSARLIFNSRRRLRLLDLFQRPADGTGTEAPVLADATSKTATSWSGDGRFVLYDTFDPSNAQGGDVWVLPLEGERRPIPVVQTPANELNARFSPDDRWITYQSDESSRVEEVYVIPFVRPARLPRAAADTSPSKKQVSLGGGIQAHWRRDGKELFYATRGGSLMAVDVMTQGSSLQLGRPHQLFAIPRNSRTGAAYDVSADGERFLINRALDTQTSPAITVVVNWTANVERR